MTKLQNKVLGIAFTFDYERRMSFQKIRLFDYALQNDVPELLNVDLGLQAYRLKNGVITHWIEKENFDHFYHEAGKFFKDPEAKDKINNLTNYILGSLKLLSDFSYSIPDYSQKTDEQLLSEYREFCSIERKTSFMNQLLFMYFEKAVTEALKDILGDDKDGVLEKLSLQTDLIPLDSYHKDIHTHLLKNLSWEELCQKYIHLGMLDVTDTPRSEAKIKEDVAVAEKENPAEFLEKLEKRYSEQKALIGEAFQGIKEGSHLYSLMRYYGTYSDKKEWKNFIRERSSYKLSKLLNEISRRASLTLDEISLMTQNEIENVLTNKNLSLPLFRKRKEGVLYLMHKETVEVIDDQDFLSQFDSHVSSKDTLIKGDIACRGIARGTARIILSSSDFYKFKKGDVLIAPTTRPDYVSLMKEASAIVTNEGGKLSHAAILSRELKKPCVIGTKIATQVLKDGMLVEVEAEKGIVRIIND